MVLAVLAVLAVVSLSSVDRAHSRPLRAAQWRRDRSDPCSR
jgi:hypothetical protein